jgi:hypothetical protein
MKEKQKHFSQKSFYTLSIRPACNEYSLPAAAAANRTDTL